MKQTKVTEWIISGNPEQYNIVDAFHNLHRVDWAQKANMTAGDIVYIYVSGNVKSIKFKCRVNKADLDEPDIDDREYDFSDQFDGTAGRYMELELIEEYVGDEYSREELMKHGFRSPQGPIRMPESVKQYLESISVFEHRYPVNTAVWIATALLSAEEFDSNPVCSKKDMYFKQTAIVQRAQKLAESSVANARCSQWCCADNDNSSNNYLRGDSEENSSLRRLSLLDEFPEKTHPEGLNMADELTMNGNKMTMEELFYFVREQYPTIIGNDSKIDYIGVLDYLRDNTDVPYSKPDAPGLAAEEVSRLLEVKKKGQNAIAELKKMAEAFAVRFKLEKCMSMSWLDGSNTKTRRYLWAPLKYGKYADNPVSVSVFVEKRNSDTCYRVSLEIKNDGDDKDIMKQYHSHLDIPLNVAAGLVYVSVSGSNEWGTPDILNKTQDEIKQEVESGKLKKVQICKYIDRKPDETNAYYHTEITKAIAAILPYYDHVLGIEKIEYYPSLAEYDPGITAEEYERILGDENIVKSAWLDTLHYLYLMGGIGTCKQIANKYGNGAAHYNTNAINVAKAVHKETNCPLCARDTGENQYWPVLFYGRDLADSADGVFSYKMREPLMEAIKALEERGVFQELNGGKYLPNFEITKLNRVRISELLELVSKHGGYAGEKNEKPYVFIIDEINRGNISKIFGELITLIESTKRAGMEEAASAILPYSEKPFSVPSNVYILGTMNTADRSIALMDTALRRRFQFIEMMPDSDVLRKIHADKVEDLDVAAMLDKINERITFLYDREHTIGHAFFTGLKDDASLSKLQSIFEKSVIPLLQEYFYEDYQKIQLVLGDNAKSDDSLKFILDEKVVVKNIFKGNVEDVIDLPEKRYSINKVAFGNINSYKEIL